MTTDEIITFLNEKANPVHRGGMKRFGIEDTHALGIPIPELRKISKLVKTNHALALNLWKTNIHEARILASMIADPALVTPELMDEWVDDFHSWDVCDQVCGNLFDRTPFSFQRSVLYSNHPNEFVKRAGFVLMAESAVHNKTASDELFITLFPVIEREAWDERNFVKKAVNWALRQIGKRNDILRYHAIECALRISTQETRCAKWIAKNALVELTSK